RTRSHSAPTSASAPPRAWTPRSCVVTRQPVLIDEAGDQHQRCGGSPMSTGHDHGASTTHRSRLAIAFTITASILIAEIIGAIWTGSLALLVDAGHMLTDTAGLFMALVAASLVLRPPTPE